MPRAILVGRLLAAGPIGIIIQNYHSSGNQLWIKVLQTKPRGLIPISVQPQQRNGSNLWIVRYRILKPTDMEMSIGLAQSKSTKQETMDLLETRLALAHGLESA